MATQAMKTFHVQITGSVQGVFFREYTKRRAETLGITGWVRNRRDGSVEALISGDEPQTKKMLEWFHQGSPASTVHNVIIEEAANPPEDNSFLIRR